MVLCCHFTHQDFTKKYKWLIIEMPMNSVSLKPNNNLQEYLSKLLVKSRKKNKRKENESITLH